MTIDYLLSAISLWMIISLCAIAFIAGFIDAVVGGGGLVQIPTLFIIFPSQPFATLFGTNKISALSVLLLTICRENLNFDLLKHIKIISSHVTRGNPESILS